VFGEVCWDSGVVMLLGETMAATTVDEWLARLVDQEVLVIPADSRFPGERQLAFRHALLREGAYATLTTDDARLAHRLAGEWLEQHGEADPMVLAGHFQRGGERARAAGFYLRAANQASYVLDYEAAIARATLGLGCDPPPELRIALLGIRCSATHRLQRPTIADAEELVRSAPQGSIPWAQGMIAYHLNTMMAGGNEELQTSLARVAKVTPSPEAAGWMSLMFLSGMFMLDNLGRVPEASALSEPFLAIASQRGDQAPLVRFWWNVSVGLRAAHAHDDPWTALVHSEAIRAIFDKIGGTVIFLNLQLLRGINHWYLGALAPAVQLLEGIPAADTTLGPASSLRRLFLSWLYADRGALDEARTLATQLNESGRAHRDRLGESRGHWVLAEVLRRMGDLDAAEREIQVALAMAMPLDHPGALATLSALRAAQRRPDEALAAAEDAMARCTAMGGCGLFRSAFVRLAHAEALRATGAHDAAGRAISDARARLLAIADKIADPGYKTSFLERVPENARTLALAAAWRDPDRDAHDKRV
jgi:tetratricopeptide (TPR) repeat protein